MRTPATERQSNGSGKFFWGLFAVELVVAGVVGWKIASATKHPWAVQPSRPRPRPPGQRQNNPTSIRGQRQRQAAAHVSRANAVQGQFTIRR